MYSRPHRRDERRDERPPARRSEAAPEERLLALQRGAGNAAVARMLSTAPARMIARDTTVDWGSDDLTRLMHIMPWKHGWDELIDVELDMMLAGGKLRPEVASELDDDDKEALQADYGKARRLMREVLIAKAGRKRLAQTDRGEIWEFRMEFPRERTRRQIQALTVVVKGFRPKDADGSLRDHYIIGDAWVETDRQEYLKRNGWNATGYVAPQATAAVGGDGGT